MSLSVRWDLDVMAISSIVHGGLTQATTTLFRRELLPVAGGEFEQLPVISGNAFRSALRRQAAELFIDELDLDGQLPLPAAAVLLNGGSLTKSRATALTGARRANLRSVVLPVGLFGGASAGVVIDGCVRASKLLPVCAETSVLTGVAESRSIYDLLQVEDYSHTPSPVDDDQSTTVGQMRYSIEVLATGTHLVGSVQADHASWAQVSLLQDVLDVWCARGTIGGRIGSGHGQVLGTATVTWLRGQPEPDAPSWRHVVAQDRANILQTLEALA